MEEKLKKQSINRLNIGTTTLKILKENSIVTIGELCNKSKSDLKKIDLSSNEINKIDIELQLEGLNLKNSL